MRCDLRLIVAGPLEEPEYGAYLRDLVARYDCSDRIDLRFGFHDRDEIARLVNGSLACAYIPIDEDSLGYVTMEAFSAGKCVVTSSDAGGLLEIVLDGETGLVTAAEPAALAESFARLASERKKAIGLGHAAKALLDSKALSWDNTIDCLLND